jgi:hypothetical protein
MFGIAMTLLAMMAIAFGAYRIGSSKCFEDPTDRDAGKNTAIVVIVLGVTFGICGMLSLAGGGGLPFNGFMPPKDPLSDLL